jgi:RNA polymerase sigma-70 factor (ECF subfamily)
MADSDNLRESLSSVLPSEEDLIGRVLSGEPDYFYELIKPYERRVYLAAYGILQNQADAEEVAQESVLKAFRGLRTFRREASFSTWLLKITFNEARMRLRRRKREHVSISIQEESGEYAPLLIADWREIPSEILERKEMRAQIEEALASLSDDHREILILRDVQGLNVAETASLLGISISSVKVRLLRARLRIRDFLVPRIGKLRLRHGAVRRKAANHEP